MANASILIGGTVIQTTNLSKLKYNLDGFLVQFTITSSQQTIIHADVDDFRVVDIQNPANTISAGYYPQTAFLNYLSHPQTDVTTLIPFTPSSIVPLAIAKDLVIVETLSVVSPFTTFYNVVVYSFPMQTPSLDAQSNIVIPSGYKSNVSKANDTSGEAATFYKNRIGISNNFQGDEQIQAATIITKIAITISQINVDIFTILNGVSSDFSTYILNQNTEWESGNILANPSIDDLNNFLNDLYNYHKVAYSNLTAILDAPDDEKLYWLVLGLSIGSISLLPLPNKTELLIFIAKNKLSEVTTRVLDEELVIKILLSFNQTNITDISPFLASLLQTVDFNSKKTLYETLYSKMSTSTNFVTGLISLSNWVLNTAFQPTKTKDHFVRAVYLLWQFSKYNPYNTDGSIKPHTFSFSSSAPTLVNFSPNPSDPSAIFTYTHYIAYAQITSTPNQVYAVKYQDAAPMVIPYESERILDYVFENYTFHLAGSQINAIASLFATITNNTNSDAFSKSVNILYGSYNIFQPVSLLSDDVTSTSAILTVQGADISENGQNINSFIPVFVLEYISSEADKNNAEAILGYVGLGLSVVDGVGVIGDLAYLQSAGIGLFTAEGMQVIVDGVPFFAGVLQLLANFVPCDPDDTFCKNVKAFITCLNLACLSVSVIDTTITIVDSLVNISLKRSAANIIVAAGGADAATIKQNIIDKISALNASANTTDLENAAEAIYKSGTNSSGTLYTFPGIIVPYIIKITEAIKEAIANKIKANEKFLFRVNDYTDEVLSTYIQKCKNLNLDDQTIIELVVFANRLIKYTPPDQLTLQTIYFVNEIKKRGYAAGFDNDTKYASFGDAIKTQLKNNLLALDPNFEEDLGSLECYVKGSAVKTWKDGDIELFLTLDDRPTNPADDIDLAFTLNPTDYINTSQRLKKIVDDLAEEGLISVKKTEKLNKTLGNSKGKLQYNMVFDYIPINGSTFSQTIVDAGQPYTRFTPVNGENKITFAIVEKGQKYDTLPQLPF